MKPVRQASLADAVPLDGRGHGRTPAVRLLIDERDKLLVEAARFFPGVSDREIARQLRIALLRYRECRWQRERADLTCPHEGTITALLWMILKTRDVVPSDRLIRLVLHEGRMCAKKVEPGLLVAHAGWSDPLHHRDERWHP